MILWLQSLSPDIKAGDIIIANKLVQHDFDVTAFGNPKGYIDNGLEPHKPTIFNSDKTFVEKFKKDLELSQNENIKLCTIATGDIFVNQENQKQAIRDEFKADAIDMESAAIAQTSQRNIVPLVVIKTISDSENNSVFEYKQNKKATAKKVALSVLSVLNKDWYLKYNIFEIYRKLDTNLVYYLDFFDFSAFNKNSA